MTDILYGELDSFNGYSFQDMTSWVSELPLAAQITDAFVLGNPYPVDVLAGGPAPLASTNTTFQAWFFAPDGTALDDCAPYVEAAWQALQAVKQTVGTLTVKLKSGGTVSCQARFVDSTVRESTREFSSFQASLVFKLYGPFA